MQIPDISELESYATEYTGRTAINRIFFIIKHSPNPEIKRQATLAVIKLIKSQTWDTQLYGEAIAQLASSSTSNTEEPSLSSSSNFIASAPDGMDVDTHSTSPAQPSRGSLEGLMETTLEAEGGVDDDWVEDTTLKAKKEVEKLETELKTYTTNLIKESIRLTHHSLAITQRKIGNLPAAIKHYTKARDYNSNPSHELEASMGIIEASLLERTYQQTLPAIVKAEFALSRLTSKSSLSSAGAPIDPTSSSTSGGGISELLASGVLTGAQSREREQRAREMDDNAAKMLTRCKAAKGVAFLGVGNYGEAAKELTGIEGKLEDWEGSVLSSSDIAIYASLTSLATLPRESLRTKVLDNPHMRYFIDYGNAAYVKDLVSAFVEAKYDKVFEGLREHEWRHLLDPHLRLHIEPLTTMIRQKAIVQYFKPFQNVQIPRMASALGIKDGNAMREETLLKEIVALIGNNELEARIDLIDKILHAKTVNYRGKAFRDTIQTGNDLQKASYKSLLHMQFIQAGIKVEPSDKDKKKGKKDEGA